MRATRTAVQLLAAAATTWVAAGAALACGGFFCSQLPMDQAGERIVFGVEEGKVNAIIQIDYVGDAADFAWVVPVSAVPDRVEVAPLALFQELDWRTAPQYYLNWDLDDQQCGGYYLADSAEAGAGGGDDGGGVNIAFEEEVGPYNVMVVDAPDAQILLDWLNDNGFDQPGESVDLLAHYLDLDFYFVAVKLKRGADVGEIQPLRLDMPSSHPCVPLVLTRIAAQPDMPVYAWFLGEHRAVPTNWFNVVINEKKIDWLGYGQNYMSVATEAIDQAAGHGFVTEFAGNLTMGSVFYYEGKFDLEKLAAIEDPAQFLDEMLGMNFPRDAQTQALIRKHIPMPEGLGQDCDEESEFYNWNKEQCLQHMPADWVFDGVAFAAELEERIVDPLKSTQAMVDAHPYTTRLFSTVSDYEMTRDPMFDFNPDLPDVDNVHTATATGACTNSGTVTDVTITLDNGESFPIHGEVWAWGGWADGGSFEDPAPNEPTAERVELLSTSGAPTVVAHDQVIETDEEIAEVDFTHVPLDPELFADAPDPKEWVPTSGGGGGGGTGGTGGGSSCRSAGTGGTGALAGLLGLLLLAVALRRRRAQA